MCSSDLLDGLGADGFVPIGSLPGGDYYRHDERHHRLEGQRTRRRFGLGDPIEVRLAEAQPVTGSLTFQVLDSGRGAPPPGRGEKPRHFKHS